MIIFQSLQFLLWNGKLPLQDEMSNINERNMFASCNI